MEKLIDKPYAYHKPSPDGLDAINQLRAHFSEGERLIKAVCVDGRYRSLAITANEQTAMWAIKAVVFNDPASEVETQTPVRPADRPDRPGSAQRE